MKKIFTLALLSVAFFNLNSFAQDGGKIDRAALAEKSAKAYKGMDNVDVDVHYKTYKGMELALDIIHPKKQLYKDGSPVIIQLHGGGWGGGNRYIIDANEMKRYSDLGIALVQITYCKQTIEECVVDCFDATRFLALNAKKYNLDMSRVAISGHSAGAHLCLMLTLAPDEVFPGDEALKGAKYKILCGSAKAPISTLIDDEIFAKYPRSKGRASKTANWGGVPFNESFEQRKRLSPIIYITKDSPKVQIIHGDVDEACTIEETRKTCEYAKKIGNEIEFHEVKGMGHDVRKARNDEEEAFYSKYLLKDIERL